MPKREVVKVDAIKIEELVSKKGWSSVYFGQTVMEKTRGWVADWKRSIPKNLPSPEEAARMCAILGVAAAEILTEPSDIEMVSALIAEQNKKPTPVSEGGPSPVVAQIMDVVCQLSPETQQKCLDYFESLLALQNSVRGPDSQN